MEYFILNSLYKKKRKEFEDRLKEKKNYKIVYVTELVSCPAKHYYRVRYPELSFIFDHKLIVGDIVHLGMYKILDNIKNDYITKIEYEKEISVYLKDIYNVEESFNDIIIKGRVDAIIHYDLNILEHIPLEVKFTTVNSNYIPNKRHVEQLGVYIELLKKLEYNVERGLLLYITPDSIIPLEVLSGNREGFYRCRNVEVEVDIIDRINDIFTFDLYSSVKKRKESWECNYCPYKHVCEYKI